MKLIERIIKFGFDESNSNASTYQEPQRRELCKVALSAPLIDISNVADYYFKGTSQDFFDIREDFPSVAPPFPVFWMEWITPETLLNRHGEERIKTRTHNGTLWQFRAFDDLKERDFAGEFNRPAIEFGLKHPNTKWIGIAARFIVQEDSALPSTFGAMYAIAENGRPLAHSLICDTRAGLDQDSVNTLLTGFHPDLLAISFMHCKNVTIDQEKRTFAERHASRGKRPVVKMYTLSIEPMKQVLRTEGRSDDTGIKQALHICRGHFKDYRKSGLFGKVKGIFWWDSTVRGSSKNGVVAKDYKVTSPVNINTQGTTT